MAVLSARSRRELSTCHPDLRRLFEAVADETAIEIICGRRGKAEQDRAFREGRSKLRWPHSRHNVEEPGGLSEAIDVVPLPIAWEDVAAFKRLEEIVATTALKLGIDVGRCKLAGDLPHWQLPPHRGPRY